MTLIRNLFTHPYQPTTGPSFGPREQVDIDLSAPLEQDALNNGNFLLLDPNYVPPPPPIGSFEVTITGTPSVGETLTAHGPTAATYQWLRDDAPIIIATSSTYVVTDADQGHGLSCLAQIESNTLGVPSAIGVRITTTGAAFAPKIELASGSTATVAWMCEETAQVLAGTAPTFTFSGAATRHVVMTVQDADGLAFDQVVTFNLGFNHNDDAGRYNMGAGYDWPAQSVSAIASVNLMTGLVRFASANNGLASVLDLSGMASLQYVECFRSLVRGANLTGCASLIRLCLEQCDQRQALDLNPVASTLRDLRSAAQASGHLAFVTQTQPLVNEYHQCIRDQVVTNRPRNEMIPVVVEEWIWSSGQSGAYTTNSTMAGSLLASGNQYTSADLTGRFPAGSHGVLDFTGNLLTSINLTGCSGLEQLYLANNQFGQATVDAILATVDGWNTVGAWVYLDGNAVPSSTGLAHADSLRARGWEVRVTGPTTPPSNTAAPTVSGTTAQGSLLTATSGSWTGSPTGFAYQWQESSDGGSTWTNQSGVVGNTKSLGAGDVGKKLRVVVTASNAGGSSAPTPSAATATITASGGWSWADDFERSNATGLTAVNNGWTSIGGASDANIVSGNLIRTESLSYQRLVNTGDGLAPADYTVEATLPQWDTLGWTDRTFFGLMMRHEAGWDDGIRAFFGGDLTDLRIGSSAGFNAEDQTLGTVTYPSSWTNMSALSHTFALRAVGNQVSVLLDGALAVTITYSRQVGRTGTAFGFCGVGGGRAYKSIRAFAS